VNWNAWIRQVHRWLSMVFVLAVVVTFVALQRENAPVWVSYLPLPPLALLAMSGLYLFVLPYVARRRSGQRTGG